MDKLSYSGVRRAYTLIEILFVIVFLGIMAVMALPRLSTSLIVKMRVKTSAQNLISGIRLTRRLAVTNNENHRLSVNSSNNEYIVYDSSNVQVGNTEYIDSEVIISADKDFIFESLGNLSALSDTDVSLTSSTKQADISLVVATGRVSVSGP